MKRIIFAIQKDYVPSWGTWEGIREIIQNALDEQARGHKLSVRYDEHALYVDTEGSLIGHETFLLGETDKRGDARCRGQHGEGLTLGLMALCREGIPVCISSGKHIWTPKFERVGELNGIDVERELFILECEESQYTFIKGVRVRVDLPQATWEEYSSKFLALHIDDIPDDKKFIGDNGTLLLDPEYKGRIYAKGIYVHYREDFRYGYDLSKLQLDRDRNTVPDFNLRWETGQLLSQYEKSAKDDAVYGLVQNACVEAEYTVIGQESATRYKDKFVAEHGKDAIPIKESNEIDIVKRVGRVPVIVSEKMRSILRNTDLPRIEDLKEDFTLQIIERYKLEEIPSACRRCLLEAEKVLGYITNFYGPEPRGGLGVEKALGIDDTFLRYVKDTEFKIQFVKFANPEAELMTESKTKEIAIALEAVTSTARLVPLIFRGIALLGFEDRKVLLISRGVDILWGSYYYYT